MAYKDESSRALRKEIVKLHLMLLLMGLVLAMLLYLLSDLLGGVTLVYLAGAAMALIALVLVASAISSGNRPLLASGASLEVVGGAIASVFVADLDDIVSLVVLMAIGPLALGQYQIGVSILTIRSYTESEGTDFPPVVKDFQRYVYEQVRTLSMFIGASFGLSLLILVMVSFFSDVMTLNSLALMGVLMGAIFAGGALLLFLKGGKVVLEEIEGSKAAERAKDSDVVLLE
jgi:hypothetical protein